jgi:hypothetical protein
MKRRPVLEDNGFEEHGGYMTAKINKLEEQFSTLQREVKKSNLFEGKLIISRRSLCSSLTMIVSL